MADVDIRKLFHTKRFPEDSTSFLWAMTYFPFGLLLAIMRFHIILIVYLMSQVLPNTPTLRTICSRGICGALGVTYKEVNKSIRDKSSRLLVSNNISTWDHLAIHLATGSVTPCKWDFPEALLQVMGLKDYTPFGNIINCTKHLLKAHQNIGQSRLVSNAQPEEPGIVAIMPEGAPTNGSALLEFAEWPFTLGETIQPIALRVSRPYFCQLTTTALGSNRNWNTFWMLFTPYTKYSITYLSTISTTNLITLDSSLTASFRKNVATAIAKELKVVQTNYTAQDAAEFEKRWIAEQNAPRPRSASPELERMAHQVKEVLPAVPINVIIKDLFKTRDVDVTLGNILEGRVPYVPEAVTPTNTSTQSSARVSAKMMASTLSSDRLSFQERKENLIREARERYIKKHGLHNVAASH